jgi:hypothetical protein
MQTRGYQNGDVLTRDAGGFENLQHRPQNHFVGNRSRDVTDEYAGALFSTGQLPQGERAERRFEQPSKFTLRIK